jgi:polysaccharide export outer membrane protein
MHRNPIVIALLVMCSWIAVGFAAETQPPDTAAASALSPDAYRLGPGDVLLISVWKDEELTRSLPVLPDGTLSFPLIGELNAGGRTLGDLKAEIIERITPFVPDPVLTLSVQQVNSMLVYVIGRVNAPGRLVLNSRLTALQALAMAGGPNAFAKRNKIKIIRKQDGRTDIFDFPYEDIIKGERLENDIELRRGDVIVVP